MVTFCSERLKHNQINYTFVRSENSSSTHHNGHAFSFGNFTNLLFNENNFPSSADMRVLLACFKISDVADVGQFCIHCHTGYSYFLKIIPESTKPPS